MTTASKAPQTPDDEYLGKTLDERYRLDEVIGAGAIGKVYAGTQLAVDRKVAIKLLHPSVRGRELGTERFLREAKAVARLSDASCLTLFDFGLDETLNCFYMVTEFVDGLTLAEQISGGALQPEQIYYVLFQVATALAHAHDCGILHRDLKPENIMLVRGLQGEAGSFESVKVLDFGLARIREEAATRGDGASVESSVEPAEKRLGEHTPEPFRLTHFGELNGTPAYMSPEQCRGDLDLTPACDYYALGVLAFELFEGHLPYEAEGVARLLSMHLDDPIPDMNPANIPSEVEDMIYRLLGKNPEHRLQSSEEVLHILRAQMTLERAQDVSLTSLERFRAPTPEAEVAIAGAETLEGYDPLDTPFLGAAAAMERSEKAVEEQGRWRLAGVGIFIALLALGALVWWVAGVGSEDAGDASNTASAQIDGEPVAGEDGRAVEEDNLANIGHEGSTSLGHPGLDAGVQPDALKSEAGDDAGTKSSDASAEPESPARVTPATSRPRKLELTY